MFCRLFAESVERFMACAKGVELGSWWVVATAGTLFGGCGQDLETWSFSLRGARVTHGRRKLVKRR